jgi:putative DNA methylase
MSKKLIEVALPLVAINKACAREKSIRHGHPSTLHLWWARRPLAAARAVIFAQMVDDPSAHPDLFPTEKKQEKERQRLFRIIEDLVQWENTTNEEVLERARAEIWQSWRAACAENVDHPHAKELFNRHKLPGFHDPFAGGGTLPLEAQRLGLESYGSDLNPVAVLIAKAMIEIPPMFAGRSPVNPEARQQKDLIAREWKGAQALAEDIRYYGKWMRDEAEKRIGHLYPQIEITADMAKGRPDLKPLIGEKLTVIAWLWARTVKSPNPAFARMDVPLASTFMLSTKEDKEAYVRLVIEDGGYRFTVSMGKPKDAEDAKNGTKLARGANFRCVMSQSPIQADYIRAEAQAGRMGTRLMAIVAEGKQRRIYLAPTAKHEAVARTAQPAWKPELKVPTRCHDVDRLPMYGMPTWGDAFTPRQLVGLTTFSDLVQEARERVKRDCLAAGMPDDGKPLAAGGTGVTAYADSVAVYLGLAVSRTTNTINALAVWSQSRGQSVNLFSRQAIPMAWDFPEVNPFAGAAGDFGATTASVGRTIADALGRPAWISQADAQTQDLSTSKVVSTDPPYYDNVGYADLSDFFYVWLRRSLKQVLPDLFGTLAVPKAEELVATPYRHGSKEKAEAFFLDGMTLAMRRMASQAHPAFPVTIYYAFKQAETETDGVGATASTGWDTFLEAVIRAGFAIKGTWPMRTERDQGVKTGKNVLASSIVLVCRPHSPDSPTAARRDFVTALKTELPLALGHLQRSNIAPVDLAQAAIGPGMAVYTRYDKVLDAEGKPLSVRDALALINQILDEVLAEQEGDFDADTRWALAWFEQYGFANAEYGVAETLSKAKNTSVTGLVEAGVLASKAGKVRLLKPAELPGDWDPSTDKRLTVWEMVHHLIRVLEAGGESAAATLAAKMGSKAEVARELAYRLYTLCERKKRAPEALAYNGLVQSWPEITRLAREGSKPAPGQREMFEEK